MASLVQVVYISRATFKPAPASGGVEPHVARILQQSRSNNPRRGLGGVLYYGNGYFFQCLEGEKAVVEQMLSTLMRDERHDDVNVVLEKSVTRRQFSDWSMKYIPTNATVKGLLARLGYRGFNPYEFDQKATEALLDTLRELRGTSTLKAGPGRAARGRAGGFGAWPYVTASGVALLFALIVGFLVLS